MFSGESEDDEFSLGPGATDSPSKAAHMRRVNSGASDVSTPRRNQAEFEMRRKMHYDEGHKMKQMLANGNINDDDDDNEKHDAPEK